MDSKDRRTKRQKLRDMAKQTASPNEAEVAKKKLEELGPDPEPPNPTIFVSFNTRVYPTSGAPINIWSNPFHDTEGQGVYSYNFRTGEWEKVG